MPRHICRAMPRHAVVAMRHGVAWRGTHTRMRTRARACVHARCGDDGTLAPPPARLPPRSAACARPPILTVRPPARELERMPSRGARVAHFAPLFGCLSRGGCTADGLCVCL